MLLAGHPSMAPLWRLATDVLSAADPAAGAARFLARLEADGAAWQGLAPVLRSPVLTISWSSSVLAAVRALRPAEVVCMASEPGGEGHRTARALAAWTRAWVIDDQEAIAIPAATVLTGADAVDPSGLTNKVGTRALAEGAMTRGVPCYAVAGETKFVSRPVPLGSGPFERAPLDLFTAVAAPNGLLGPEAASKLAAQAEIHRELLPLLAALNASA